MAKKKTSNLKIIEENLLEVANQLCRSIVMYESKGTEIPRGDIDWIMNYPVPLPTGNLLYRFVKYGKEFSREISFRRKENKLLDEIKFVLLSMVASIDNKLDPSYE